MFSGGKHFISRPHVAQLGGELDRGSASLSVGACRTPPPGGGGGVGVSSSWGQTVGRLIEHWTESPETPVRESKSNKNNRMPVCAQVFALCQA